MDENTIRLFGSKKTDDWCTPKDLYRKLDGEFHFDFDPCPLHPKEDGLSIKWGERCFVNPPYSKVEKFLAKAWSEINKGNTEVAVFLTFANTDTKWFHKWIYNKAEIRFIKGRLKFWHPNKLDTNSAMRPSMITVLTTQKQGSEKE